MNILIVNDWKDHHGGAATFMRRAESIFKKHGHRTLFVSYEYVKEDIDWLRYTEYFSLREIYSWISNYAIRKALAEFRPDVAYVGNAHDFFGPSVFRALKKNKVPIVWQVNDYFGFCQNRYAFLENKNRTCSSCLQGSPLYGLLRNCSGVLPWSMIRFLGNLMHRYLLNSYELIDRVCVSSRVSEDLMQRMFPSQKLFHVINPVAHSEFSEKMTEQKDLFALYAGSKYGVKGLYRILEAMPLLSKKVKLVFALGPDTSELAGKIFSAAQASHVAVEVLPKTVNQYSGLKGYQRKALCTLIPSEWSSPSEYVVYESMLQGTMPILPDMGGSAELFPEELRGYLYKSGNTRHFAETVNRLFDDPKKAAELGAFCFEYSRKRFDESEWYRSIEIAFKSCLG